MVYRLNPGTKSPFPNTNPRRRAKTGLQQVCIAAAMNVSRIVNWLDGRQRAKTRVTRFAALAPAA
jgi:hypothetical protein